MSVSTARRRLVSWGAYTSYNKNGQYYTLADIPRFNEYGLWRDQGVFFSEHGNLVQTLVHLLTSAEEGYSAAELGKILGLLPRSFLAHFRHHPALFRKKVDGRFVWFAADPNIREKQLYRRGTEKKVGIDLPSSTDAVFVLAELIRHPRSTPEALANALRASGIKVTALQIENLLVHHDLVKKTANSMSL